MTRLTDSTPLRRPVLLVAFEGWNDAGDAASDALDHLADGWGAREIAALDPDDYYDFQVNRPFVRILDDGERSITWPTCRFSVCSPPGADRDVVLVRGHEPNMRWRDFCAEVLEVASELGVELVVTLGALLADSPHTRPVPVNGTASDPATTLAHGLERSRYEGPTGIIGVLQHACAGVGLPAISFWAAVPHYVSSPPVPKAVLALLHRVEDLLDLPVPLGELPEQAREWESSVDAIAADDPEVREYIAQLEEREPEEDLPEASGEAIAKEFERYLRRGGGDQRG